MYAPEGDCLHKRGSLPSLGHRENESVTRVWVSAGGRPSGEFKRNLCFFSKHRLTGPVFVCGPADMGKSAGSGT